MREPRPAGLTRDRAPGSRSGGGRPSAPGGSARGVAMTVSKSCPPGPTSRTARSPRRGRALPPLQSLGGSLHYRGSNGGRVCTGIRAGSADSSCPGLALPNPGRAGGVLAAAAFRHSCSFRGSGWCACLRACVCARVYVCPDTHVPPTHACSYLLAKAAVGAMAAKDAAPDDQHPHGGTAALSPASRMAIEGQEAGQPLSLMLITKQALS